MNACERSLRTSVQKWFGYKAEASFQVLEFGRTLSRKRFVRIGILKQEDPLAIVFFRHDDGSWNVFPPMPRTLSMQI
ncbi:hypothetical protein ABIE53_005626 [Burkholderia sp. OAS925]|jgi:hypothetical protein|nr:hypothetical protein [Paraburkholderia graminis]